MEIAYLAGLFDGDGCVRIVGHQPIISITNKDLPTLIEIRSTWGGSIRKPGNGAHRWELTGAEATSILLGMLPFISAKRAQVTLVLDYSPANSETERSRVLEMLSDLKNLTFLPELPVRS
jgi:intein/homing endonuclease